MSYKPILLITGGAGYVGSTLMRDALAEGYRVRCLDLLVYGGKSIVGLWNHPNFDFIKGDVRNKKDLEEALDGVDAIIHLAAIVGDLPCQAAPKSAYQINFQGTRILADMAKKRKIKRFIYSSTCSTYGVSDTSFPIEETNALSPISLYAESKIDSEKYLLSLKDKVFHPTILRFGTAYGVSFRTRFDLLINSFAYEALTEEEIVVFAAKMWRPYVHVRDMGVIILNILKSPENAISGEIFNAGATAHNYTKEDIIKFFLELLPGLKVEYSTDIDDKRNYRVNCSKLENRIGFKPTKTVKAGIEELIYCFKKNILTKDDFESNNLNYLKQFFAEQETKLTI